MIVCTDDEVRALLRGKITTLTRPLKSLRVILPEEVRSEGILFVAGLGRSVQAGRYFADLNPHGAVTTRDPAIGLRPGEFHLECPYVKGSTELVDYGHKTKLWTITPTRSRVWVREAWRTEELLSGLDGVRFRAGNAFVEIANTRKAADAWFVANENGDHGKTWRTPRSMPRWASRLPIDVRRVTLNPGSNVGCWEWRIVARKAS